MHNRCLPEVITRDMNRAARRVSKRQPIFFCKGLLILSKKTADQTALTANGVHNNLDSFTALEANNFSKILSRVYVIIVLKCEKVYNLFSKVMCSSASLLH